MNLVEFIRKNDIQARDGSDFDVTPEFRAMKAFERKAYSIKAVPFLDAETDRPSTFDVRLQGRMSERWHKKKRRTVRRLYVDRTFRYPGLEGDSTEIDDSVEAGSTLDEAVQCLGCEIERFLFFKRYDLIDYGRYWLNRDLKRCLVLDGEVVVLD